MQVGEPPCPPTLGLGSHLNHHMLRMPVKSTGEMRSEDDIASIHEHRHYVAEGTVAHLIRSFVHALRDVSGCGRYPDKVRQAMQVVAISTVRKAVALSKTKTSIKEIGDALGLTPRLISECRRRFDA